MHMLLFLFFFYCSATPRDLHSFPTRRSSDLSKASRTARRAAMIVRAPHVQDERLFDCYYAERRGDAPDPRSEEHTSELQSHVNLVCRLLLEKKKKRT